MGSSGFAEIKAKRSWTHGMEVRRFFLFPLIPCVTGRWGCRIPELMG